MARRRPVRSGDGVDTGSAQEWINVAVMPFENSRMAVTASGPPLRATTGPGLALWMRRTSAPENHRSRSMSCTIRCIGTEDRSTYRAAEIRVLSRHATAYRGDPMLPAWMRWYTAA